MNRLSKEKSPYLLQHADNPVAWHAWGEEAFEKARREDKPLFLSIGYSTCHWCHVMERESFEDEAIAALLNEHFISVKVDREERPDVDRVYMTAVQAMTGSGGWPLSVFLTPDLKPFFGGTYFPPEPRWGQPGFPQLLARVAELWKTRRAELAADSEQLAAALKGYVRAAGDKAALDKAWLEQAARQLASRFDTAHGGFGGAPKFPMPVNLEFLLSRYAVFGDAQALGLVVDTLKAMARGGIHDQIGGGFHRYSTDERWFLPHFEKMLYDNAQLAGVYLDAYRAIRDQELAAVARGTLDYLLRDMAHAGGGFYSAEDADSAAVEGGEKSEGAFYLWTTEELESVLGKADAAVFSRHYGIEPSGNVESDPHGEFKGKNLPYQVQDAAGEDAERLKAARATLLETRSARPRPARDEKILVSWNGLALSAFAKGFQVLGEPRYLEAARRAAAFLHSGLWDEAAQALFHRWAGGERGIRGNADDYAFLVQGLLDLYEADFDPAWLEWALALTRKQERLFAAEDGGYFLTAQGDDDRLLARVLEDQDNVEPCASSVAVSNLLRLAEITGDRTLRDSAEKTLTFFGGTLRDRPLALPRLLAAAAAALRGPMQVVLAGDISDAPGRALLEEVRANLLRPHVLLAIPDAPTSKRLAALSPGLKAFQPPRRGAVAFVCFDFACEKPASDPAELRSLLKKAAGQ